MPQIEIRPARSEDREAVLAFSSHTWDWGDYIEYVWDEWLHDPQGMLFVATSDGQPVGVAHIRMLNKTEAWLEGMRVAPAFRRQGIAPSQRIQLPFVSWNRNSCARSPHTYLCTHRRS